ncbi:MAG: hypothetical protein Q4B43_10700 [Bacteroidota bacterium]|nr:hypothetical protein [Bacteroidota bacterium]
MKKLHYLLVTLLLLGCGKDKSEIAPDNGDVDETQQQLSSEKNIVSFKFSTLGGDTYPTEMRNDSIFASFPAFVSLTTLYTEVKISDKAKIEPNPNDVNDYSSVVTYTVTAEDSSKKQYKVIAKNLPNSEGQILKFNFINAQEDSFSTLGLFFDVKKVDTINLQLSHLTDLKKLTSDITLSNGATVEPKSGETLDYTKPVHYKVTSEDKKNVKNYVVIVKHKKLDKVILEPITGDTFRNKKGGDVISFQTNVLPVQDSIKVQIISKDNQYQHNLAIQSVDYTNNQVNVFLPATYVNHSYKLEISVGKGNKATSYLFDLDAGTPVFKYVTNHYNKGNPTRTLLFPGEKIEVEAYVNRDNFAKHEFFVRKNGQYLPLKEAVHYANSNKIILITPNEIPITNLSSGTDFEFVIKYDNQEYAYPLVNSVNSSVKVYIAKKPQITGLSKAVVTQEDKLIIYGKDFFYPITNKSTNSNFVLESHSVLYGFMENQNKKSHKVTLAHVTELDEQGNIVLKISRSLVSGIEYTLGIKNNVVGAEELAFSNFKFKLELPQPTHPTIRIESAKIYNNQYPYFAGQLAIKFNTDPTNINIKEIDFPGHKITNFITYSESNTIMTNKLTDQQYNYIYRGHIDGYVLIEDNGKEYKLYFKFTP